MSLLQTLQHEGVVKLLDIITDYPKKKMFLVFEYFEHDLKRLMESMQFVP